MRFIVVGCLGLYLLLISMVAHPQDIPVCDKCEVKSEQVVCYEGYGVGIRLCPRCEKESSYLATVETKTDRVRALKTTIKGELETFKTNISR